MQTLPQPSAPVKRYVTIRRHASGAWQPLYVDARGTQILRIYTKRNDRPNVESATKFWALTKNVTYQEPEVAV